MVDLHRPSIDLVQKIGNVICDDIYDVKPERLGCGQAHGRTNSLFPPIRVAAVEFGEAADICHRVVHHLARLRVDGLGSGILPGLPSPELPRSWRLSWPDGCSGFLL